MLKKMVVLILALTLAVMAACSPAAPAPAAEAPVVEAPAEDAVVEDEWGYVVVPAGEKIKIGLSSALSAGYAVYGNDMLNGVTLAIENFGGELKGWEVIVEGGDDQCEGAPGVTVAEQFSADPYLLGVVGPMCSGSVVPASDIYADNNIIMFTPSSTAVIVTARGLKNIFRTVANDDLQAQVTVDYLKNELGIKTLALFHDQSIYGQGVAEAVAAYFVDKGESEFDLGGGTVTAIEGITRGDTDFSAIIATILKDDPEAIYWGGMDAEGALLINQLRAAGFEGGFFGPDGIKSKPSYVDASGGAAEGSFMTFGAVGGETGYDEFEAAFTAKFGEPVAYGPGSYDSALIMLNAADAVAFVDEEGNLRIPRKALADKVRETPFSGVTGYIEFDENGDLKVVSITVFKVIDGEIVPQKVYDFGK